MVPECHTAINSVSYRPIAGIRGFRHRCKWMNKAPIPAAACFTAALLLGGCASADAYPKRSAIYWDQPTTEWYWVPDGVEPAAILRTAGDCGAHVDGSVANHGVVPTGFAVHVFKFVGENTSAARDCTIKRLGATPQLTTYLKNRG